MEPASSRRLPTTPSMPLFPVSPERLNANTHVVHASKATLMASPSLPNFEASSTHSSPTHAQSKNSDVQGMVARFNALEIKDHQELRRRDEAALKRAQMGREQAEEEVIRVKGELRSLRRDVEEGRERERRVARRLENVMEQLHSEKEKTASMQKTYEREIRRARKEAFKSSSHLLETQKELKVTKAALNAAKVNLETWVIPDGEELKARAEGVELELGKALRLVEHMKMECQFGACACRLAEMRGEIYVADGDERTLDSMARLKPSVADTIMDEEPPAYEEPQRPHVASEVPSAPAPLLINEKEQVPSDTQRRRRSSTAVPPGEMMVFSPNSGTFRRAAEAEPTTKTSSEGRHHGGLAGALNETTRTASASTNDFADDDEPKTPTTPATSIHALSPKHDIATASEDEHEDVEDRRDAKQDMPLSEKPKVPQEDEDEVDTIDDPDELANDDEDPLDSPTTHIRATTQVTTVPLAPLSSPSKSNEHDKEGGDSDGESHYPLAQSDSDSKYNNSVSGTLRATTPLSEFDPALAADNGDAPQPRLGPVTPKVNTEMANTATVTPAPKSAGEENILSATPWESYSSTPLTRDEAIAMLRARRGRARTNATGNTETAADAGTTPKRSASHGSALVKGRATPRYGAVTPSRRDISTLSAPDLSTRTPGGRKR